MKKSVLSLTLLIGLSVSTSLFSGAGPSTPRPGEIQYHGLKRSWQCRNRGKKSGPETKKRLAQNKCTPNEIRAGHQLVQMMIMGPIGAAIVGGGLALAVWQAERKKEQEGRHLEKGPKELPITQ